MIARTIQLTELLNDAILIAEESSDPSLLHQLRGARLSLESEVAEGAQIAVDAFTTRVWVRGLPLALTRSEIAVVFALCLHERGSAREDLAEMLYPGVDTATAVNALKVNIHRARRRLGIADAIRFDSGRYVLGNTVDFDLPRLEAEVRRLRNRVPLDQGARTRLRHARRRSLEARPGFVLEWLWFDALERRLRDFAYASGVVLARDALRLNHFEEAIDLALDLSKDDPLDEAAAEIAIRAFLMAGDRTAAVLAYRRYASSVARELDISPPCDLRDLIDG